MRGAMWLIILVLLFLPLGVLAQTERFKIFGEVVDRDETSLLIWGFAVPLSGNHGAMGANETHQTNLMIQFGRPLTSDDVLRWSLDVYCFVKKGSGVNSFGAPVSVWYYSKCKGQR